VKIASKIRGILNPEKRSRRAGFEQSRDENTIDNRVYNTGKSGEQRAIRVLQSVS
jgi:hypothetical protein